VEEEDVFVVLNQVDQVEEVDLVHQEEQVIHHQFHHHKEILVVLE
jgi:hypothetical protein